MTWKPIPYLPGYEVSDTGTVRRGDKLITIHKNKERRDGSFIKINLDGKQRKFSVAKLVAQAFIPNPEDKPFVRHLHGDSNEVSNLAWCTRKELMEIMVRSGRKDWTDREYARQFEYMKKEVLKPVIGTDVATGEKRVYVSIKSTELDGFTPGHVWRCAAGRTKTHGGFYWRYADADEREEILKDAHDGIVRREKEDRYRY